MVLGELVSWVICAQQYPYKAYRQAEGLLNLSVEALTQDGKGYIWAATENGVFRYDGSRFVRREGVTGWVTNISLDAQKRVVVVRHRDICRDNGERFSCVSLPSSDGAPQPPRIAQPLANSLRSNRMYVVAGDLFRVDALESGDKPGIAKAYVLVSQREAGGQITSVHETRDGAVWFGCHRELCRYEQGEITRYNLANGLGPGPWTAIVENQVDGALYVRSADQVAVLRRGALSFEVIKYGEELSTLRHARLYVDREGSLYVPSANGVLIWSGKSWRVVGRANGWPAIDARTVVEDHEGSLWIGSAGTGVIRWIGRREWANYGTREGLDNPSVWAVLRDADQLWVGCEQGLFLGERGSPESADWRFRPVTSLGKTRVRALVRWHDGSILAGTSEGIFAFRGRANATGFATAGPARQIWPLPGYRADKAVRTLFADSSRRLWIGLSSGLMVWKQPLSAEGTSSPTAVRLSRGPNATVSRIIESAGAILAATHEGLIHIGRSGTPVLYDDTVSSHAGNRLPWNALGSIALAAPGEVWLGGLEEGLGRGRFDPDRNTIRFDSIVLHPEAVGRPEGHGETVVYDIASTGGSVWLATDRGIDRFDGERWTHYNENDGLVWNDTSSNGMFADPDGSIWIGTSNGLSHFTPMRNRASATPPSRAVLHSVLLGGQRVDPHRPQIVDYQRNSLSVGFSLLSYANETNREYEYRINNLSRDWTRTQQASVEFPELPPGSFRLEVRARSGNGPWSDPESFQFEVEKPFWSLWSVRISACIGLVWLALVIQRRRKKDEREQLARLERAVAERTKALAAEKTRAEEATRARTEFLANMSHEIRTPMNAVLGMTSLLLDMETTAEARDFLNTIRSSSASLLTLLNDILDFSKIESGKLEFEHHEFDLRQCVEEAADMFSARATEKGLELAVDIDPELPAKVVGDVTRLRQILVNLISNAVKFTNNGEVVVSARKFDIELGEHRVLAAQMLFSVRDTGPGIPKASVGRLFQTFSQVDASTTRRFGGTGLGLAICKRLAQLMGGTIWVDSIEGRGSDFQFTLPIRVAAPGAEESDGPPLPLDPLLAGLHILVADDHPATLQAMARRMRAWGLRVQTASSVAEAMELAERFDFRVAFIDHPLGVPELVRRIQRNQPRRQVVLLTPAGASLKDLMALHQETASSLASNGPAFLAKPVRSEQLRAILLRSAGDFQSSTPVITPAPSQPTHEEVDHSMAERIPLRILVVEDNVVNQKVALGLLGRMGYKAAVAENGEVAIDKLQHGVYDVVLLDVQMPVMDGYETAREIHRLWPGARPRIIGLSANAMQSDRDMAIASGMDDYLTKPLAVGKLQDALRETGAALDADPETRVSVAEQASGAP